MSPRILDLSHNRRRRNRSLCIRDHVLSNNTEWRQIRCQGLGQSKDSEHHTDCAETEGEDDGSDLDTSSRAGITTATSSGVGRPGSSGGLGAGGTDRGDTRARSRGSREAAGTGESGVDDGRSVGNTVGGGGDLGLIWHRGNDTQRLGGLSVGLDLTVAIGVDTGEVLVVTLARLEGTILGVVGGVVGASDTVVDVLAEVSRIGASRIASLETESVTAHEVVPLDDLLVVVLVVTGPCGGVEETTEGVTAEVGTVGVELSSEVIRTEVDEPLVDETDDLNVVGGPHELNTLQGTSGDETSSMTGLGTPGNFLVLRFADCGGTGWGCPEAEV